MFGQAWLGGEAISKSFVCTAGIDGVFPTPAVVYLQISQLFSLAYVCLYACTPVNANKC